MLALTEAQRAGLLGRQHWLPNIVSGVIVGIVALPLAMAFAIASGAKPEQGLYTAIIAGFLVSALGGSRLQIAGPTGAFIVILSGITAKYGIAGLQIATLMAGVILLLLGLARMGTIIRFIPDPVILGFTAGIGIIIWVGQWRDFFGLPAVAGEHFHEKLWHLFHALPHFDDTTTALAALSLALVIYAPKVPGMKRVPGPLVALVVATTLQAVFHFASVRTIGSAFGGIPSGLPTLQLPAISIQGVIELIGPAFTIAMLGAIESLLSAVIADGMTQKKHDPDAELVALGIGNIVAPFFGGIAATGALARTATNVRAGGRTPVSAMVHSVVVLVAILVLAPTIAYVPMSALAGLLLLVAWNMSEIHHALRMLRVAPKSDITVLVGCYLLTVVFDMVIAVSVGVVLAALLFMRRMAELTKVRFIDEDYPETERHLPEGVVIYEIAGPLFFGAAQNAMGQLDTVDGKVRVVVLALGRVPTIDATGIVALDGAIDRLRKQKKLVVIAGPLPEPRRIFDRAKIGSEHEHVYFTDTLDEAVGLAGGLAEVSPISTRRTSQA